MIKIIDCDSFDQQKEILDQRKRLGHSVLFLDKDLEGASFQYVVDFEPDARDLPSRNKNDKSEPVKPAGISIAINTNSLPLDLCRIQICSNGILLLGGSCKIFVIDPHHENPLIKIETSFYAPFFEFLPIPGSNDLLAIWEIDVARLDDQGNILWRYYSPDIITFFEIKQNFLLLNFFEKDSPPRRIDLATGKIKLF